MVKINKLRSDMGSFLESEKNQKSIYVSGNDLDEILREAAIQLSTPIKDISYEVLQVGRKGFMGFKASQWSVLAYVGVSRSKVQDISSLSLFKEDDKEILINENGKFFLRLRDNYLLKVTAPIGIGSKVTLDEVLSYLREKGISHYDKSLLEEVIEKADGSYHSIGKRSEFNPTDNPIMSVDRSEDNMQAFITISQPGEAGADVTEEEIKTILKRQGIVEKAYLEKEISDLIDNPIYAETILVAQGLEPINGEDGSIKYNYKKNRESRFKESLSGQIDFKEVIFTQNVRKGDVLAEKISPTKGEDGFNLDGKILLPKRGEEASFLLGTNVELSEDGNQLLAACDGYISFEEKLINVHNIFIIDGDVGIKTGNIYNNGSVLIKGGIADGYQVIVKGNLEIMGSIGKVRIESDGDVVLHSGVNGNHESVIKAKGNIWAKFIENCRVESGKSVYVSDGILHSNLIAEENVICQGKRAKITGGSIMAYQEVSSLYLGTIASGEMVIEVGFKPRDLIRFNKLKLWLESLDSEVDGLNKNIQTFEKNKKGFPLKQSSYEDMTFSKEEVSIESLKRDFKLISKERELVHSDLLKAEESLNKDQVKGRVSVEKIIYPKVVLKINGLVYESPNEMERVSFIADDGLVKAIPYEPISLGEVQDKPSINNDKEKKGKKR